MDIPLWILLVPLACVIFFSATFLVFNIFHLARYGIVGRGALGMLLAYIISYAVVLLLGLIALSGVAWTESVPFVNVLPFSGESSSHLGL